MLAKWIDALIGLTAAALAILIVIEEQTANMTTGKPMSLDMIMFAAVLWGYVALRGFITWLGRS